MKTLKTVSSLFALTAVAFAQASLESILAPLAVEPVASVASIQSPSQSRFSAYQAEPKRLVQEESEPVVVDGIRSEDIHAEIERALEVMFRPNGELKLIALRELPDLSKKAKPFVLTVVSAPSRIDRGNFLVRYQIENEQGVLGEWSSSFRPHVFKDAWFVTAHLRRGDMAAQSDFEVRRTDLLVTPDAVPADANVLGRHDYSRDIAPGKPLVWQDLMERSLIKKRAVVEVVAKRGLLQVTMRAEARQDGAEGDIIVLRNLDTSKEFSARVLGVNRAEAIF